MIENDGRCFIVTNMHAVTGRDPVTGEPTGSAAATPTALMVWHYSSDGLGRWVQVSYDIYDADGRARWLEHPANREWDFVAIPIGPKAKLVYHPNTFTEASNSMVLAPGSNLSIIGFPFGTSSDGRFGIWSRATVASGLGSAT